MYSYSFQSTLPVWGATSCYCDYYAMEHISIHAPRVGSDSCGVVRLADSSRFQSTLPVWGATYGVNNTLTQFIDLQPRPPCGERRTASVNGVDVTRISIHAPRVGSDLLALLLGLLVLLFQSTLPVWGATKEHGAFQILTKFQSTLPVWGATFHRQG